MSKKLFVSSKWKKVLASAAVLLSMATASPVFAWNDYGHQSVACIAYRGLTPAVRKRAMELLQLNPYYPQWEAMIPTDASPSDKEMYIFMLAATWPDAIKKQGSGYFRDRKPNSVSNEISDYSDKKIHGYWHYCDMGIPAEDGVEVPPLPVPNAQTQIHLFRGALGSNISDEQKSYALCWVLHLVGDVHQPLHCATRVSKDEPNGDAGGNNVKLHKSHAPELHAFWDDVLGKGDDPEAVAQFARLLPPADEGLASISNEQEWINESNNFAKTDVYVSPVEQGDGPFELDDKYESNARSLAEQRVELAGARLANLLNHELR